MLFDNIRLLVEETVLCNGVSAAFGRIEPVSGCLGNCRLVVVRRRVSGYPCLCLWRLFGQMTSTTPWRRMTLHFSHIGFTEARTFIVLLLYHGRATKSTRRSFGIVKQSYGLQSYAFVMKTMQLVLLEYIVFI